MFLSGVLAFLFHDMPITAFFGPFFIILAALPSYYAFSSSKNWKVLLGSLIFLGFFMEILSMNTGFPYGFFSYGEGMGPKVLGVPFTLAFAWPPLVLGAYYTMQRTSYPVLGTMLLLVLIDLVLDPVAVLLGHWEWSVDGFWYGVPLSNFVGWLLTGFIAAKITEYSGGIGKYGSFSVLLLLSFWVGVSAVSNMLIPFVLGLALWGVILFETVSQESS